LLAVGSTVSALLAFVLAASMLVYSALGPASPGLTFGAPKLLQLIVLASAVSLIGALFLAASYYSIQTLRDHEVPAYTPKPLRSWQWAALLSLWIASALLAQVLFQKSTWAWLTPAFYLAAIGTPAYFFVRLAAGGLHAGSSGRIWGILATAMAAGTGLALLVEAAFMILGILAVGIYLALHPTQLAILQQFASQLASASGREDALGSLGPWLEQPVVLASALVIVSGLIPVIEETAKAVAVWAVFDHLDDPSQGFVAGALSGAGFGLVESLLASATPDSNWSVTLVVRGASTMMHIMAAGLTGWGIASFRAGKRAGPGLGAYGLAIALHSLWNASVVMVAFGGVRTAFNLSSPDALGTALIILGSAVLTLLCITIPFALAAINRRLRSATDSEGSEASASEVFPGRPGRGNSTATPER
jgi:hypothetical protein